MGKKLFRTKLFGGYNKKDVYNYLEGINSDMVSTIAAKDKQLSYLMEQNKTQTEKLAEFERDRDKIVKAIMRAEEAADLIITKANMTAAAKEAEAAQKLEQENKKIAAVKSEILALKQIAIGAAKRFETELDSYKFTINA